MLKNDENTEYYNDKSMTEIIKCVYEYLHNSAENSIKFYENQCDYAKDLIEFHKQQEPFILFKNSHTKWEKNLMKLNKDYNNYGLKLAAAKEELSKLKQFNKKTL